MRKGGLELKECQYVTVARLPVLPISGSGGTTRGWVRRSSASVGQDFPRPAACDHDDIQFAERRRRMIWIKREPAKPHRLISYGISFMLAAGNARHDYVTHASLDAIEILFPSLYPET